jgi:hypothetical protein
MHPLVAFAVLACIVGVHDDTVGAPIDLRCADFNEFLQFLSKPLDWTYFSKPSITLKGRGLPSLYPIWVE